MLYAILCILLSVPSASTLAEFFVPGPPPYPHWTAGDVQKIRYSTTYTEYTIALWQQLNGAAKLGPILFQTTAGPDQEFDWVVQTYDLDLDTSDKFYLWLFEGGPSAQGNQSIKNSQSSGFFFISAASTTTTTTTASSSSPSPSPSSSSAISSSSTAPAAQSNTGGNSKPTGDASQNNSSAAGGLSTGAKAGIGVGAAVGGLALLAAILLFVKYRSKKRKQLEELQSANNYLNYMGNTPKMAPPSAVAPQPVYELPGNHDRAMTELG